MYKKSFFMGMFIMGAFFIGVAFQAATGDKVAYVEIDKVLQQMPEAKSVQDKLKGLADRWQEEFAKLKTEYDESLKEYERKKSMMNDAEKKKKEQEIMGKGQTLQEYQNKKLGRGGELEQKQMELFKPLEEKVMAAVEKVAKELKYDLVLSKGGPSNSLLYGDKKNNITYDVLKKL